MGWNSVSNTNCIPTGAKLNSNMKEELAGETIENTGLVGCSGQDSIGYQVKYRLCSLLFKLKFSPRRRQI